MKKTIILIFSYKIKVNGEVPVMEVINTHYLKIFKNMVVPFKPVKYISHKIHLFINAQTTNNVLIGNH